MLEPWIPQAVARRTAEFAAQLHSCPDGTAPVPGLDWNVVELAQHVACLPRFWANQHQAGNHFEQPEDFAAFSDQARAHITETDVSVLADLVEAEFGAFLEKLQAEDGRRWLYGVEIESRTYAGLSLNELILHGRDLAPVSGHELPSFERREANLAVAASMLTAPAFIDADKARSQPDGVYHIKFRGGDDYTWTKRGADLVIESGRPEKADAHLNADPAIFLMASLGRYGQVKAALTGAMVTYGRKPWRFLGLGGIAVDGV